MFYVKACHSKHPAFKAVLDLATRRRNHLRHPRDDSAFNRRRKYGYRLAGAMVWVTAWSLFQLFGYMANIIGSYGGNLFEYPGVYPLNYLLGALSIFTPDIVGFIRRKVVGLRKKK